MVVIFSGYELTTSNEMSDIDAGRRIHFENGFRMPSKMIDAGHVSAFMDYQRALVESLGHCEGGCKKVRLIQHHTTGKTVCCMTLEPCPRHAVETRSNDSPPHKPEA